MRWSETRPCSCPTLLLIVVDVDVDGVGWWRPCSSWWWWWRWAWWTAHETACSCSPAAWPRCAKKLLSAARLECHLQSTNSFWRVADRAVCDQVSMSGARHAIWHTHSVGSRREVATGRRHWAHADNVLHQRIDAADGTILFSFKNYFYHLLVCQQKFHSPNYN